MLFNISCCNFKHFVFISAHGPMAPTEMSPVKTRLDERESAVYRIDTDANIHLIHRDPVII